VLIDELLKRSQNWPSLSSGHTQLPVMALHVPTSKRKSPLKMQLLRALTGWPLQVNSLSPLSRRL
jgi:hypothetical protein